MSGSRGRFELRYTLTHPASRERICSAGDVLRDDTTVGALVVGGIVHDRAQQYASHYTVEYLMVRTVTHGAVSWLAPSSGSITLDRRARGIVLQRALGIGAGGIDEEELKVTLNISCDP